MQAKDLLKRESRKRPQDRIKFGCYLVITVTSFLLYYNTIRNDYALDDKAIITENQFTEKGFAGVGDHLTTSYWEGIDKKLQSYRPLSPVLFAVEVGFWGFNPHASHFVNILLYAVTGLILFQVLRKLFQYNSGDTGYLIPLAGTLLFLAHPIHTEVVANLKSRDTMLEFLFLLLSVNYLFSYITSRKMKDLIWSVFFFFPALLSKESSISYLLMVPVILILYDQNTLWKKIKITLLYLIPVVLFLILFFQVTGMIESTRWMLLDNMLIADEPYARILATKFLILGKYLGLLFYPHPLVFDYSYNHISMTDFSNPVSILSMLIYLIMLIVLVVILGKNLYSRKTRPLFVLISFCIAWFFMGLAVSSNLFFLIGSTMAERFMYLPSLGFVILLVLFIYHASEYLKKKSKRQAGNIVFFLLSGIIFIAYLVKTIDRNRAWKDDFTLFSTDLPKLQNNVKANDFLANIYVKMGDSANDPAQKKTLYLKAIELKEKAVTIYPDVPEIQQKLGFLYGNIGRFDKAIEIYRLSIRMNPNEVYNYVQIGKAYGMIRQPGNSIPYLEKGIEIFPNHPELLHILGISYAQTGKIEEAIICFQKALNADPENEQFRQALDYALHQFNVTR